MEIDFVPENFEGVWYEIAVYPNAMPHVERNKVISVKVVGTGRSETGLSITESDYQNGNVNNIFNSIEETGVNTSTNNARLYFIKSPLRDRNIDIRFTDFNNYAFIFEPQNTTLKVQHFRIYCRRPQITKEEYINLREFMKCFGVDPFRFIVFSAKLKVPSNAILQEPDNIYDF